MKKFILLIALVGATALVSAQNAPQKSTYIVQEGENLYRIALRNKVSVTKLCEWNSMQPLDALDAGREIIVVAPKTAQTSAAASSAARLAPAKTNKQRGDIHRVQSGETVPMIANTYGYTEERFRQFNQLQRTEKVEPGRELKSCDCSCAKSQAAQPENSAGREEDASTSTPKISPKTAGTSQASVQHKGQPKSQAGTSPKTAPKAPANQPVSSPPTDEMTGFSNGITAPSNSDNETVTNATITSTKTADSETKRTTVETKSGGGADPFATPSEIADKADEEKAIKDAPACGFMSPIEMAMVDEINFVRTLPKTYIPHVEAYIKDLTEKGDTRAVETARELIGVLNSMTPCGALATSECVFTAAKKHAIDQKPKGDIDHQGKDGSFPWDRIPKECPMMTDGGECLVGGGKTVRRSVLMLLVDDGIANRGHRTTILDPTWKFVGCYSIGTVGIMKNYWIQNYGK